MQNDHLRNAGQNIVKGSRNAAKASQRGDLADAAESAVEGLTSATQEIGRSIRKNTRNVFQGNRQDK